MTNRNLLWHTWKTDHLKLHILGEMNFQARKDCTNQRKISTRIGPYILRWGHSTTGKFSVKDAYYM
jgi:hypothetical protein